MKITIEITDERLLNGIAFAREKHNDGLPAATDPDTGRAIEPRPGTIDTDQAYVEARIAEVLQSYCAQAEAADVAAFRQGAGRTAEEAAKQEARRARLGT